MPEKNYKTEKKRRKKGETADEGLIDFGLRGRVSGGHEKGRERGGQESMNNDGNGGKPEKR